MATTTYNSQTGILTVRFTQDEKARADAIEAVVTSLGLENALTSVVNQALERSVNDQFNRLLADERNKIKAALDGASPQQIRRIKTELNL